MVVFGELSPQLVVMRSILTRLSSMNKHRALRGADFFCSLSAAKQGYAASSHCLKYCQSNVPTQPANSQKHYCRGQLRISEGRISAFLRVKREDILAGLGYLKEMRMLGELVSNALLHP